MKIEVQSAPWFTEDDRKILQLSLERMAVFLGLENPDESLRVKFFKRPACHCGNPDCKSGTQAAVKACKRHPFDMRCSNGTLWETIKNFSHEMVHIKQMTSGDLGYKDHGIGGTITWKDKTFPSFVVKMAYTMGRDGGKEHLPWEDEAYGKQDAVFKDAVHNIPFPAQLHLAKYGMTDRAKVEKEVV
jgi:hypothetical protein